MAAFTGFDPRMTDPLHPGANGPGKYGNFDYSRLQALDPSNAPSPPRVASQGALPAGPAPAASSPSPGAFMPDEGKGAGEARKPGKGRSFFDIWAEGSMEDKQQIADRQEEMLRAKDMNLESATMEMIRNGGEPARMLAEKFGITGVEEDGLAFRDPAAVFEEREKKGKKKLDKAEKRAAMGGFLMEMGLRILQSDKQTAGGQIAEGALGTMEARRARKMEAEDRAIAKAELERQRAAERRAEERERQKLEQAETRLGYEGRRVTDQEKRTKMLEEEADDPDKGRKPYQFEVMRDAYMNAHSDSGKSEQELRRDFLSWYKGESKLPKVQVARIVNDTIKSIDESLNPPEGWQEMTFEQKKDYVLETHGLTRDDVEDVSGAADDPLGLFSE